MPLINSTQNLRSAAVACIVALVFVIAAACTSSDDGKSITGQVVEVEARSITEFETLTIIDSDGQQWEFIGGLFAGFTPSHLNEHMALQEPVKVWYVEDGDQLRVTRVEDG